VSWSPLLRLGVTAWILGPVLTALIGCVVVHHRRPPSADLQPG
jgi:undecaprenyl-diphosphatase